MLCPRSRWSPRPGRQEAPRLPGATRARHGQWRRTAGCCAGGRHWQSRQALRGPSRRAPTAPGRGSAAWTRRRATGETGDGGARVTRSQGAQPWQWQPQRRRGGRPRGAAVAEWRVPSGRLPVWARPRPPPPRRCWRGRACGPWTPARGLRPPPPKGQAPRGPLRLPPGTAWRPTGGAWLRPRSPGGS